MTLWLENNYLQVANISMAHRYCYYSYIVSCQKSSVRLPNCTSAMIIILLLSLLKASNKKK
uniref:Uncharacterized protein n=1 Tax=Anguilla anguilla TaxID=7936 RepID=A0A0E9WA04_ANGAN